MIQGCAEDLRHAENRRDQAEPYAVAASPSGCVIEGCEFDEAAKEIEPLANYVHIISEEDRDYYNAAKIGVKERHWS